MDNVQPRRALVAVEPRHYRVFMSIFKGEVNARYELKEKEFIKAMEALGFEFSMQKKGNGRQFVPVGEVAEIFGRASYTYGLHGKLLEKDKQDVIAKSLRDLYGWNAQTFVLDVLRAQ